MTTSTKEKKTETTPVIEDSKLIKKIKKEMFTKETFLVDNAIELISSFEKFLSTSGMMPEAKDKKKPDLNFLKVISFVNKDKTGYYEFIGYITKQEPDKLSKLPLYEFVDVLFLVTDFFKEVKINHFFILTSTTLSTMISGM